MTRKFMMRLSICLLFWIGAVLALPGAARAATLTVCPSGCTTTTIQAAINAASAGDSVRIETAGPHTEFGVVIDRNLTIEGLGELQTIVQAGAAPQVAPGRVFTVEPGRDVTIRDMTIRYGNEVAIGSGGGGVWIRPGGNPSSTVRIERVTLSENYARDGGGILNHGDLTLTDVEIRENGAAFNGGGLLCNLRTSATQDVAFILNTADRDGGGIYKGETDGPMSLHGVLIESNRAEGLGGGIFDGGLMTLDMNSSLRLNQASHGGGLYQSTTGTATIRNSAIAQNQAFDSILTFGEFGGGLHIRGALDISDSLVQANQVATLGNGRGGGVYIGAGADVTMKRLGILQNVADEGGGIYLAGGTNGSYLLEASAVTQNSAIASGGGIFHFSGDATLINVTIGSNAAFASGAGLFAREGNVDLSHVTITENLGDANANGDDGGGVSFCPTCTPDVRLFSSIVADNHVGGISLYPDCNVTFGSGSYSLIGVTGPGGGSNCTVAGATAGMLFGISPDFDASTGVAHAIVHPLLAGSPAIDSGSCADGLGGSILYDQRGASVPIDGDGDLLAECDMGAYEYLPEPGLGIGVFGGFGLLMGLVARRGTAQDG